MSKPSAVKDKFKTIKLNLVTEIDKMDWKSEELPRWEIIFAPILKLDDVGT